MSVNMAAPPAKALQPLGADRDPLLRKQWLSGSIRGGGVRQWRATTRPRVACMSPPNAAGDERLGRRADTGAAYCANYGPPYRLTRNWDERGGRCNKDVIANLMGSTTPQIVQERLSDFLWEWQSCLDRK